MRSDHDPGGPDFTDDEVREILRRAAELERHLSGTSLADLTSSAEEAGLNPRMVTRAAAEVIAARANDSAVSQSASRMPEILSMIYVVAAGAFLGGLTGLLEAPIQPHSLVDIPSFIALVAAGAFVCRRSSFSIVTRALQLTSLLFAYGAGWALVNLDVTRDLVTGLGFAGVVSVWLAMVESEISAYVSRRQSAEADAREIRI